jgi:hypothetical protein
MQAFVQSPGPKSFVITPPNPAPGFMPSAPAPALPAGQGNPGGSKTKDKEKDEETAS